ncbi:unnamed protein product [Clonostachys rhizophaga]|uniref:Uncharacterized protein n=1 Tax=Clonostachys rhizophaga TaxID=160324 RepID=A0A9N9VND6_9HYPO|nr:unnamed protein product [Clonostachys rhizophaga]
MSQQFIAPTLVFAAGITFAVLSFLLLFQEEISVVIRQPSALKASSQSPLVAIVDADIAGVGIRFALWAQISTLVVLTIVGSFHCRALGAKEIGAGLAIAHTSLAVALVAQMKHGSLTSADAIVGAMLLDAQGSAMSIVLGAKDVLAARWQTWISIACQTFGLTVLFICVIKFGDGEFVSRSDDTWLCLKPFWWGWIAECPETAEAKEATVFWLYLACRMVGSVHAALFAAANTGEFHDAEKSEEPLQDIRFSRTPANVAEDSQVPGPSSQRPDDGAGHSIGHIRPASYSKCRATVTYSYVIHTILSAMSMVAVQRAMDTGLKPSAGALSTGQINSMVVAFATVVRGLWLLLREIYLERNHLKDSFRKKYRFVFEFFAQACRSVFESFAQASRLYLVFQDEVREDHEVELDARE